MCQIHHKSSSLDRQKPIRSGRWQNLHSGRIHWNKQLVLTVITLLFAISQSHALAQTSAPVSIQSIIQDIQAEYTFGEKIEFQASLQTNDPLKTAYIFIEESGNPHTITQPVDVVDQGDGIYQLIYTLDLNQYPLRAFSIIDYRFDVTLGTGETVQSEIQSLDYIDNRHEWQSLSESPFTVHWYEGRIPFAQSVLDAAQAGLLTISNLFPRPAPAPVDIYIYSTASELQETLTASRQEWIAGHADPDLSVIAVSLPVGPDQQLLTEQRIPHELAHILLYRLVGSGYTNLPVWLKEGLASLAELVSNTDYQLLLDEGYSTDKLLPIGTLCNEFPQDASGALIAYAQSAAFSDFIYRTYGTNGLQALIASYADGLDCQQGAKKALGVNLSQLEQQWRQERFGENITQEAWSKLLPWFVLALAVFAIPLVLIAARLLRKPGK